MERTLLLRHRRPTPGLFVRLWAMLSVRRERARLRDLDDHLLRDIGLDRARAEAEASRPLWDVPVHWLR